MTDTFNRGPDSSNEHVVPLDLVLTWPEGPAHEWTPEEINAFAKQQIDFVQRVAAAQLVAKKLAEPPPPAAEWLIALCTSRAYRSAILGDMHSDFLRNIVRVGERQARRLYWAEALRSTVASAVEAIKTYIKLRIMSHLFSK